MDAHQIGFWAAHHTFQILSAIGNILLVEKVIKDAAQKRGYKEVVSICDKVSDLLNFILDILSGIVNALKNKNGGQNAKDTPDSSKPNA